MALPIPEPIRPTFTIREAAAVHLLLLALIERGGDALADRSLIERANVEFERTLKKAGCVLNEEGWHV